MGKSRGKGTQGSESERVGDKKMSEEETRMMSKEQWMEQKVFLSYVRSVEMSKR